MNINKLVTVSFLILSLFNQVLAQEKYEFIGVIELEDKSVITYNLVFSENDGEIEGFSITDLQGEHETENKIIGNYDKKKKEFSFKEEDIIYTKSPITQDDFCFINFSGKLKLEKSNSKLEGDFKGLFNDGKECINGSIKLVGTASLYNKMNKLNKKINKTKLIDEKTKVRINPVKLLDSLRMNTLREGEKTSVFWKSNIFKMQIWDAGKEDGDRISILVNGKKVLDNYTISHSVKEISFPLEQQHNTIVLHAENEGEIKPNTSKISLFDGDKEIGLYTNLDTNKDTTIILIKRK